MSSQLRNLIKIWEKKKVFLKILHNKLEFDSFLGFLEKLIENLWLLNYILAIEFWYV